ncbi:hypothetical protein EI94DRAFT_1735566 [Lactarius quietus]|nr:hypothetical protein EI94DRAFT_1735566 [Lactarius quietus]
MPTRHCVTIWTLLSDLRKVLSSIFVTSFQGAGKGRKEASWDTVLHSEKTNTPPVHGANLLTYHQKPISTHHIIIATCS